MGFTRDSGRSIVELSQDAHMEIEEISGPISLPPRMQLPHETVAALTEYSPPRPTTTPIYDTIAKTGTLQGQTFWRSLTQHVYTIIKANCTAHVISSA